MMHCPVQKGSTHFEQRRQRAQRARGNLRQTEGPARHQAFYHQYAEETGGFISDGNDSVRPAGMPA